MAAAMAGNESDRTLRERLMKQANAAFKRGDAGTLREVLEEYRNTTSATAFGKPMACHSVSREQSKPDGLCPGGGGDRQRSAAERDGGEPIVIP